MLNLAGPCQQLLGGQPLSNESMNINLDIDNLDFIHLDFHHLETLVHKLPNSRQSDTGQESSTFQILQS